MTTHKMKRLLLIAIGFIAVVILALSTWLNQESEYLRVNSPSGGYTAIVTYRRYEALLPAFPGQSGDKAGFIRIEDSNGQNYGKVTIPMVWMSQDLEWTDIGARLTLVGEWDFTKKEYRYWNEDQTQEIMKYAK